MEGAGLHADLVSGPGLWCGLIGEPPTDLRPHEHGLPREEDGLEM